MNKKLLCIGTYLDKKSDKQISKFLEFTEGVSKTGHPYGICDVKQFPHVVEGSHSIGTVLNATLTIDAEVSNSTRFTGKNNA